MRRARPDEVAAVKAFLLRYAATSMFPLSNLDLHGTNSGHPRAVTFWLREDAGGITDVLTVSDEGMVFPQCNSGDWNAAVDVLRETGLKGLIGEADQVAAIQAATGLPAPDGLDMREPHYQLCLKDIVMPDTQNLDLIPLGDVPRQLAKDWRAAFCEEALNFPTGEAGEKAAADVRSFVAQDSHRVLRKAGVPVAMTGFNAVLPDIVQVGGVYTPPENRGKGYARSAVALHLAEMGADKAILSAATPAAARAYEAIGFQRIGAFSFAVWPERQHLNG